MGRKIVELFRKPKLFENYTNSQQRLFGIHRHKTGLIFALRPDARKPGKLLICG
jgi:hypothetical protein